MINIWEKYEIEVHYLSIKTKISAIRHKHHFEICFKFKPWDGHQMVNIESLILYFGLNLNRNTIKLTQSAHSNLLGTSFKIEIQ